MGSQVLCYKHKLNGDCYFQYGAEVIRIDGEKYISVMKPGQFKHIKIRADLLVIISLAEMAKWLKVNLPKRRYPSEDPFDI